MAKGQKRNTREKKKPKAIAMKTTTVHARALTFNPVRAGAKRS